MVHNLPDLYRTDPWILTLASAFDGELEALRKNVQSLQEQLSLDTVSWNLAVEERLAGLNPRPDATEEQRRTALKAQWRSSGKTTIEQIQAVADAWHNGAVEVQFVDGTILVQFVSLFGVPEDLRQLEKTLELIIPAHLAMEFMFRYFLIRDIHQVKTLSDMERLKLNQFSGGGS